MKDNTSVLFREGTVTESLPITGVTTFTKNCITVGYFITKRVKTVICAVLKWVEPRRNASLKYVYI